MKYHELQLTHSPKKKTRVGRGISAGKGKTAGRGTKGQKARSGYSRRPGFEGGQNPLMQRFPKLRGFHSKRQKPEIVFTDQLNGLSTNVNNHTLADSKLVSSAYVNVTVLKRGDVKKKVSVELQKASGQAITLIEKAGGTFKSVPQLKRPASSKKTKATSAQKSKE